MTYLKDIIQKRLGQLAAADAKLVKQLCNKITDSYYPDEKIVEKLRKFSTPTVDAFLLDCLTEYDSTERTAAEHHDIISLRAVWAVLAFSQSPAVLSYFQQLIDQYISGTPFFLNYLFEIFSFPTIQHPLCAKIETYYDSVLDTLPSYQLLNKLGTAPANRYKWAVDIELTTDGARLTPSELTDEERTRRFKLHINFGSPRVMGNTYEINIENCNSSEMRRIKASETEIFTIKVDKNDAGMPNLLQLRTYVEHIEQLFNIRFQYENIAYLSVSKGINKRIIKDWIQNRFQ